MDKILVLDFGSQVTQLIARRIRSFGVYSEIVPFSYDINKIKKDKDIKGIILSGSHSSVFDDNAPKVDNAIFELGLPTLGICYGLQLITHLLGGVVVKSNKREYGHSQIEVRESSQLYNGLDKTLSVWMSHSDKIKSLPTGFIKTADSESAIASFENADKKIYGVQFHPEVVHTKNGDKILNNFVFNICETKANWDMYSFIETKIEEIRNIAKDKDIVLGISGGVDSSVLAILLYKAIGNKLKPIFIDNGLLRKNEAKKVVERFKDNGIDITFVDASARFLSKLSGVDNPEEKRKKYRLLFVEEFFREASHIDFLAQGTLYPDVIESVSTGGPSDKIKTHHNLVDEILALKKDGRIIEPFSELFKDEVREIGRKLGLSDELINRHPFPGPGLAVRIIGDITEDKLNILQDADEIIMEEVKKAGIYNEIWQIFGVLLPIRSVGVMGDGRTYSQVLAIRGVESVDAMTADWYKIDYNVLGRISNRIINEVDGINRVVYDVSSKPPATIEWE